MKKCNDCNVEMIENAYIEGQHPFELGADGRTDISVHIPTGEKEKFLWFMVDKENSFKLKARVCPKCGKVELFIHPNKTEDKEDE